MHNRITCTSLSGIQPWVPRALAKMPLISPFLCVKIVLGLQGSHQPTSVTKPWALESLACLCGSQSRAGVSLWPFLNTAQFTVYCSGSPSQFLKMRGCVLFICGSFWTQARVLTFPRLTMQGERAKTEEALCGLGGCDGRTQGRRRESIVRLERPECQVRS